MRRPRAWTLRGRLVHLRLLVRFYQAYRQGAAGAVVEPGTAARADVADVLAEAEALLAVGAPARRHAQRDLLRFPAGAGAGDPFHGERQRPGRSTVVTERAGSASPAGSGSAPIADSILAAEAAETFPSHISPDPGFHR